MNEIFEEIAKLTKAIADNPNNVEALKLRAVLLSRLCQWKEALDDCNTLIDQLGVEDALVYNLRGGMKMQLGDKAGALEDMKRGVELQPDILDSVNGQKLFLNDKGCH